MNHKPDERTLISYIYEELSATEKEAVELYFQDKPEEWKSFVKLQSVRTLLGQLSDREVIAPKLPTEKVLALNWWQSNAFRIPLSIAASLLIVLFMARLLNTQIQYSNGELHIAFGKFTPKLDELYIQQLINASLKKNNTTLKNQWTTERIALHASIRDGLNQHSSQIQQLMKKASQASKEDVKSFVANYQKQNIQVMNDYLQLSTADQKKYIQTLLVEFSSYVQQQRNQDLIAVQTRLGRMEKNRDELKNETEQLLASIISTLDESAVRKTKNY